MGILYLFTGGLLGIGWFVDIVKAFIGMFKEDIPKSPDYVYYSPTIKTDEK